MRQRRLYDGGGCSNLILGRTQNAPLEDRDRGRQLRSGIESDRR